MLFHNPSFRSRSIIDVHRQPVLITTVLALVPHARHPTSRRRRTRGSSRIRRRRIESTVCPTLPSVLHTRILHPRREAKTLLDRHAIIRQQQRAQRPTRTWLIHAVVVLKLLVPCQDARHDRRDGLRSLVHREPRSATADFGRVPGTSRGAVAFDGADDGAGREGIAHVAFAAEFEAKVEVVAARDRGAVLGRHVGGDDSVGGERTCGGAFGVAALGGPLGESGYCGGGGTGIGGGGGGDGSRRGSSG